MAELAVPESALAAMQQAAKAKGKSGYLITLSFHPIFPSLPTVKKCRLARRGPIVLCHARL